MSPSPEQSSKWLSLLLPVMERGGPILSMFLLLTLLVSGWYLLHALQRQRELTKDAYERLLTCVQAQATLGQRCYGSGPR